MNLLPKNIIEIPSDLNELARVRDFTRKFCKAVSDPPLPQNRIDQIVLAVNEAVTNIMEHAYQDAADKSIQIEAGLTADQIVFRLYDKGKDFDIDTVPMPKFDGSKNGGFGVFIISQIMDEMNYYKVPDGRNCMELKINISKGD